MAAQILLALPDDRVPEPARETEPPPELRADEVEALRRVLPHMRPERFTRRDPAYWRAILERHAAAGVLLRPPSPTAGASRSPP